MRFQEGSVVAALLVHGKLNLRTSLFFSAFLLLLADAINQSKCPLEFNLNKVVTACLFARFFAINFSQLRQAFHHP